MLYSFCVDIGGTGFSRISAWFSGRISPVLPVVMWLAVSPSGHAAQPHEVGEQLTQKGQQVLLQRLEQWRLSGALAPLKTRVEIKLPSGVERLPACSKAIWLEPASDVAALWGQISLRAGCESPQWQLNMRAKVEVDARLPVLKASKTRGDLVSATDIVWQWQTLGASDRSLVTQTAQLAGKQVVRRIRANQPIKLRQLQVMDWVSAGQQVVIQAGSPGFTARMTGQALENGGEGEAIRVKNLSSGKVISAYPIAPGVVETRF